MPGAIPELTAEQEAAFFATGTLPADIAAAQSAVLGLSTDDDPPAPAPTAPATPADAPATPDLPVPAAPADMSATLADLRRTLEAKLNELETKLTPRAAPVAVPDPSTDPLGNMIHQLTAVNERIATLDTRLTESQQQNLLRQQYEQFTTSVRAMRDQFKTSAPDFDGAYTHIRNIRAQDLRDLGVAESDIPQALHRDELQLAQSAISRGKNPAEELYNMAKRYGFAAKAAPVPAAPAQSPTEKLETLRKGAEAARNVDRAAADTALTVDGLKDAGNDDLNKLVQDDKAWNSLLGGKSHGIF